MRKPLLILYFICLSDIPFFKWHSLNGSLCLANSRAGPVYYLKWAEVAYPGVPKSGGNLAGLKVNQRSYT